MFHDGRLEADPAQPGGIRTPLGAEMAVGFDSVLSAQAMFPVLSGDEMAGHYAENEISALVRRGLISQPGGSWDALAARVAAVPEYRAAFDTVLGEGAAITFPGAVQCLLQRERAAVEMDARQPVGAFAVHEVRDDLRWTPGAVAFARYAELRERP